MPLIFVLLLPFAIVVNSLFKLLKSLDHRVDGSSTPNPQGHYWLGLNYLLSEQPDKAMDALIKAIEIDSSTIETHLALGVLFRKHGEVERAIRLHQNLAARPQLTRVQRVETLLELGKDYLSAGMLDRAEGLFLEVIQLKSGVETALQHLLQIYQQEKSWHKAIATAERLFSQKSQHYIRVTLGHYHCELAELAIQKGSIFEAQHYIKQAINIDPNSVRANLLLAKLHENLQNYKAALQAYKCIEHQDPLFIGEAIPGLLSCYRQLKAERAGYEYIRSCYDKYQQVSLLLAMVNYLQGQNNPELACQALYGHLQRHPSFTLISEVLKLKLSQEVSRDPDFSNLLEVMAKLRVKQPNYRCEKCGFASKTLLWLCPSCRVWNTIKPILN